MSEFTVRDPSNCTVIAPDGHEFQELSCVFPKLEPLYLWFEKYHEADKHPVLDYVPVKQFLDSTTAPPIIAVTLYALFCYFGQKYMANRKPFNFRNALAAWNLFLTLYSAVTVVRGIPAFYFLATNSFKDNCCRKLTDAYGGSMDVWTILFVLSKFAELIDTFFIVAHKKPLIFLHWWHHITVLLYTWIAFQEKTPSAVFFGPINAGVHSIMYGYYFLMAVKMKPKWFNPIWITIAQLVQMVVGVTVSVSSFYYYMTDASCSVSSGILWAALMMYGSYLYLFAAFFYGRYIKGNKDTKFAGETVGKKHK